MIYPKKAALQKLMAPGIQKRHWDILLPLCSDWPSGFFWTVSRVFWVNAGL